MHHTFAAAFAFWQLLTADLVLASPLHVTLLPRSVEASATISNTPSNAPASSATTASVTLYQNEAVFAAAAPTVSTSPSSGCVIVSQTATTYETLQTVTAEVIATVSANVGLTAGFYCYCAPASETITTIVEVGTYYDRYGTAYLWCETAGAQVPSYLGTTVVGATTTLSPQASASPGDPLNPDWADVSCTYGSIPDLNYNADPWQVWNDSGAEAAWNNMVSTWNAEQGSTQYTFNNFVWSYFNGPPSPNCDSLDSGSCSSTVSCGQHADANPPVSSPAGYVIINSMVLLHRVLQSFSSGIGSAKSNLALNDGPFAAEFSPITEELAAQAKEKVALDIIQLVVGAVGVFFFEAIIPALPFISRALIDSKRYAALKTQAYLEFGAALGLIKDKMQPPDLTTVTNEIDTILNMTVTGVEGAANDLAGAIFNDPNTLYGLIQNGQFFSDGGIDVTTETSFTSAFDVEHVITEALFANALPLAWSTGTSASYPFIATGEGVAAPGASGCDGFYPSVYLVNPDIPYDLRFDDSLDFFQSVFFCVDNAPYWLFTGATVDSNGDLAPMELSVPHNLDYLNGSSLYGLQAQTVAENAVRSWILAGKTNTFGAGIDISNIDQVSQWESGDLADVTGLVQIPVCSFLEAGQVSVNDPENQLQNPAWPCPQYGATGSNANLTASVAAELAQGTAASLLLTTNTPAPKA